MLRHALFPALAVAFLIAPTGRALAQPAAEDPTIVDVAVAAGDFDTLVAAVKAAGLAGTLSGEGPFTVFAPTDAAFAALPDGTVESLLEPENVEALRAILTYHVVAGRLEADAVLARGSLETLQGGALAVASGDDGPTIGGAAIVATDVAASNGVIHVIDAVLVPESAK